MNTKRVLAAIPAGLLFVAPVSALAQGGTMQGDVTLSPFMVAVLTGDGWVIGGGLSILVVVLVVALLVSRRKRSVPVPMPNGASFRAAHIARNLTRAIGLHPDATFVEEGATPYLLIPGKQLKRYVDRTHAPLWWHRFTRYVVLPLNGILFLIFFFRLWMWYSEGVSIPQTVAADIPIIAVEGVLTLVATFAFCRWRKAGVWCYLSIFWLGAAYHLINYGIYAGNGASVASQTDAYIRIGMYLGELAASTPFNALIPIYEGFGLFTSNPLYFLGEVIVAIPLTIYYCKRSLLFSPKYRDIADALQSKPVSSESVCAVAAPVMRRFTTICPSCGARVIIGERTCETCGGRMDSGL